VDDPAKRARFVHVVDCEDYALLLSHLDGQPVNRSSQERMTLLLDVSHDYSRAGAARSLSLVWRL